MPLTLTLEDGSGLPDANSYANVAACDAYHAAHLYATAWTAATSDQKAIALVMATRTINNNFNFYGYKVGMEQGLDWPRARVPNPHINATGRVGYGQTAIGAFYDESSLPRELVQATCEMARELLTANRTQDDASKGIASLGLGQGAISITFNPGDRKQALTDEVLRLLEPLGTPRGGSRGGQVKTMRVQ